MFAVGNYINYTILLWFVDKKKQEKWRLDFYIFTFLFNIIGILKRTDCQLLHKNVLIVNNPSTTSAICILYNNIFPKLNVFYIEFLRQNIFVFWISCSVKYKTLLKIILLIFFFIFPWYWNEDWEFPLLL